MPGLVVNYIVLFCYSHYNYASIPLVHKKLLRVYYKLEHWPVSRLGYPKISAIGNY